MTKEEIIKPENLVYKKPTLMNDNAMHYCPGCSHGVVHKLIAEVIEEMGMEDKTVGISPVQPSNAYGRTVWYSLTSAMVTLPVSVQPKQSMHSIAVRISLSSSSTMPYMV